MTVTLTRLEVRKAQSEQVWYVTVPSPREGWDGPLATVRVKSVRTGAVSEFLQTVHRPKRATAVRVQIPKGTAGLEPGEMVAVSLTPIDVDVERWFQSDESRPLLEGSR